MILLTKKVLNDFAKVGDTSEKQAKDINVVAKFFLPGKVATWYVAEYNPETGEMFGYAELVPGCGELGYFNFNEIKELRGMFGLPLERDRHFEATLQEVIDREQR